MKVNKDPNETNESGMSMTDELANALKSLVDVICPITELNASNEKMVEKLWEANFTLAKYQKDKRGPNRGVVSNGCYYSPAKIVSELNQEATEAREKMFKDALDNNLNLGYLSHLLVEWDYLLRMLKESGMNEDWMLRAKVLNEAGLKAYRKVINHEVKI